MHSASLGKKNSSHSSFFLTRHGYPPKTMLVRNKTGTIDDFLGCSSFVPAQNKYFYGTIFLTSFPSSLRRANVMFPSHSSVSQHTFHKRSLKGSKRMTNTSQYRCIVMYFCVFQWAPITILPPLGHPPYHTHPLGTSTIFSPPLIFFCVVPLLFTHTLFLPNPLNPPVHYTAHFSVPFLPRGR